MVSPQLLCRQLFCRNGHGIHSPFVYDFITNVVEAKHPYYAYYELYEQRLELEQGADIPVRKQILTCKKALQTYDVSEKEGRLLFRLTHHYKTKTALLIGSGLGLASLYVTAHAAQLQGMVLESEPGLAAVATNTLDSHIRCNATQLLAGNYTTTLPTALQQLQQVDFLYWGKGINSKGLEQLFEQCLPYLHPGSVVLVTGLRSSAAKQQFWQQLCKHPRITVSVDLYRQGVAFLNPQLHQRTYLSLLP